MQFRTPICRAIALAFGSAALAASSVHAQSADSAAKTERIEITGSSIKRIQGETALPVQVLNREEIARTGVTTVEQLLKTVTATSSLGSSSVANSGAGGGQGGANSGTLISLRGLGSARTLVLINGRRSAPSGGGAAVDIGAIPLSAIERVEVLKDGASAIYGSDAVAGVVNFILRKNVTSNEISATIGTPTRSGGGKEARISGFGGFNSEAFGVTYGASYQKIKPIFADSRSFARNLNVENGLDKLSTTSFPANVRLPSGLVLGPTYPDCGPYSQVSPFRTTKQCVYDNAPYIALQPDSSQFNANGTARYTLSPAIEAYAEGSFTRNTTLQTTQHVLINGADLKAYPGHPYTTSLTNLINSQYPTLPAAQKSFLIGSAYGLLPPSSPYYPTAFAAANGLAGQPLVLLLRSVPNGTRQTEDVSDNTRLVGGLRGVVAGWDYDAGLLYSRNKIKNSLKQGWAETDKLLNLINSGVVNPFGETASASVRQAIYDTNYNGLWTTSTTSVTGADVTASRSLLQLDGGQMSIAVGAAMRKEKLDIAPVDANQKFLVSGFGAAGVPLSKDRTVASAFTELNVPVLKNLELNGALRYDRYEKVGSTVNPKASLRWQPLQPLLVRASFGKGFRAPTLNDLYSPPSRGITTNGSRDLVRCPPGTSGIVDCSTQFVTLSQGVDTLKPEKSVSRSLGFLFEPNKDISAGIDFFDVEVNDIIRTDVSTTTILANPTLYASYILRGTPDSNPSGVGPIVGINQLLVNGGRTKVTGFDVDFKARVLNTATDKVTFRLAGTYVSQYAQQNSNGTYTDSVNSAAQAALGIGVILRWRNTSGLTWDNGPYSVTLSRNYQNRYQDDLRNLGASSPIQARFVEAYTTFDLQGSYTGFKSIKLTGGIKNLLDKDPPYTNYGAGFVGSYDLSYTDVRGRFAYVSATYTF